jgi:putative serine protease PepD
VGRQRARIIVAAAVVLAAVAIGAGLEAALGPSGGSPPFSAASVYHESYRGVVEVQTSQSQGSGFVFDSRGDVVTNDHVISGARVFAVTLANGEELPARLVGAAGAIDLAVLRISAPAALIHPLRLGNSDLVVVGEPVIAIGSPFGLNETVSGGIVSALHRSMGAIGEVIQTDISINEGNSGGPLIDAGGQVIGINTETENSTVGSGGVAFAIPSNTVAAIVPRLIAGGSPDGAYLGVVTVDAYPPQGAQVTRVIAASPAARAGLRIGDVIVGIGDATVTDAADLATVVDSMPPGEQLAVTYLRAGNKGTVRLALARHR